MLLHHFEAWTKVIFVNWQNEKIKKLKKREKRKGELLSSKKNLWKLRRQNIFFRNNSC